MVTQMVAMVLMAGDLAPRTMSFYGLGGIRCDYRTKELKGWKINQVELLMSMFKSDTLEHMNQAR